MEFATFMVFRLNPMIKTKLDAELAHFKRRFYERTGYECSKGIHAYLLRQVREHHLILLKKQSHRVSHFLIQFCGKAFAIVYDKQRRQLVTILDFPARRSE